MCLGTTNEANVSFLQLVYSDDANNEVVNLACAMFDTETDLLMAWNSIPKYNGPEDGIWLAVDLYDEDADLIDTRRISQQLCEELAQEPLPMMIDRGKAHNLAMQAIWSARISSRYSP